MAQSNPYSNVPPHLPTADSMLISPPTEKLLGVATFSVLTYTSVCIIFSFVLRSAVPQLASNCTSTSSSGFLLPYTHIPPIDYQLCLLVAFFDAGFATPASSTYLLYLVTHLAPVVLIPLVEANRPGRSLLLAFPLLIGVIYQRLTAGAVIPAWFLLAIATGAHALAGPAAHVGRFAAESIHFALVTAYFVPTVLMMLYPHAPRIIVFWQMFPLWMTLAQYAYRTLFSSRAAAPAGPAGAVAGQKAVQRMYTNTFVLSAIVHWYVVGSLLGDIPALKAFFFAPLTPVTGDAVLDALHTLQWDGVFFWAAPMLGSLWWARNALEVGALVLWHAFATAIFGPGAAISGAAIWRESIAQGTLNGKQA
jgi:hypothetical protein